jgi:hypothetical protein
MGTQGRAERQSRGVPSCIPTAAFRAEATAVITDSSAMQGGVAFSAQRNQILL